MTKKFEASGMYVMGIIGIIIGFCISHFASYLDGIVVIIIVILFYGICKYREVMGND